MTPPPPLSPPLFNQQTGIKNIKHLHVKGLSRQWRGSEQSGEAVVLSYYPCPALVQPHHTPFVPDVFSSPCCFQDMPINLSALWVDILVSLWWPPLGAFVLSCLRTGTWAPVFVRRCISVTLTVSHSLWVFNVYASHRFVGNQAPPVVSEKFRIEFFHYINLYKNYRINVILSNPEKNVCFFSG